MKWNVFLDFSIPTATPATIAARARGEEMR
jgi:hypothetical protein